MRLSHIHNIQTGPGTQIASYSMGTGVRFRGLSGWGVKLTIHPPLSADDL